MKRLLLCDDSASIRNLLKTSFMGEYEVVDAENGQAALDLAKKTSVDFFLLDVNMPVMDGLTLVRELRKLSSYAKTPVVMLTSESRDEKRQQGKEAGANGWVTKPCDPDALLGLIRKMI
jgi:two-component system chemotaxis response regulator CheY